MNDIQKFKGQLLQWLNFNAQDVGMIRLRNKEIGDPLQVTCTALWIEVCNATEISKNLHKRLDKFHADVELMAKRTGLYK